MILVDSDFYFSQQFLSFQHTIDALGVFALSLAVVGDIFPDGCECEGAQLLCKAPEALFGMIEVLEHAFERGGGFVGGLLLGGVPGLPRHAAVK